MINPCWSQKVAWQRAFSPQSFFIRLCIARLSCPGRQMQIRCHGVSKGDYLRSRKKHQTEKMFNTRFVPHSDFIHPKRSDQTGLLWQTRTSAVNSNLCTIIRTKRKKDLEQKNTRFLMQIAVLCFSYSLFPWNLLVHIGCFPAPFFFEEAHVHKLL